MKSRARSLLDKSLAAMISAIEVYNKPDFQYREETFSVLAVNAWELLLKARILQLSRNRLASILIYQKRQRSDGTLSEKMYKKMNRTGNPMSISLFEALQRLKTKYGEKDRPHLTKNLELLVETRDNAVHFLNKGGGLEKRVQELATASLKNYLSLVRQWFGLGLLEYNFFLMPLAFFRDGLVVQGISLNREERRLLEYFNSEFANATDLPNDEMNTAIQLEIKLSKVKGDSDTKVEITRNDPKAIKVTLSEEDIREKYPWNYEHLTAHLRNRYSDFLVNNRYHKIRKNFEKDERFCKVRLLDPSNLKSSQKKFYNPNIVKEFDKTYKKS